MNNAITQTKKIYYFGATCPPVGTRNLRKALPFANVLSWINPRVPAKIVFDQVIGDIFGYCQGSE